MIALSADDHVSLPGDPSGIVTYRGDGEVG